MRLTIQLCTYKRAHLLGRVLEALFDQTLDVSLPTGFRPPITDVGTIPDQGTITEPTEITAGTTNGTIASYVLAYAPLGDTNFVTIASGNSAPPDGVFGLFDTTGLADGPYDVRLTTTDTNNLTSVIDKTINVEGHLKLGNFAIAFLDISASLKTPISQSSFPKKCSLG